MAKISIDTWRRILTYLQDRLGETTTRGGIVVLMASLLKFLPVEVATAIIDILPTTIGLVLILLPDAPPTPVQPQLLTEEKPSETVL